MAELDAQKAIGRFAAFGSYKPGRCLEAVDKAFAKPQSDRPGHYTYALRAAEATPANRRFGRDQVRAGMVLYFSASSNGFGHICIATDNAGSLISTDIPVGKIGRSTIAGIERAWGRKFLFASDWLMGHDIVNLGPAKGAGNGGSAAVAGSGNRWFTRDQFKAVQGGYNALGYGLAQDGIVGPKTTAAIRDFQGKHGLTVDGIHGPATEAKLVQVVAAKAAPAPAPAPGPGSRPTVQKGSTGEQVKILQERLRGAYPAYAGKLANDGIFGVGTKAVVKEFQRRAGLTQDGIVGPVTWKALGL
jgi:hypothetical protein